MICTTDLSKFGDTELQKAIKLLQALSRTHWSKVKMTDIALARFELDGVKLKFNSFSGEVFLSNSDKQELLMNEGKADLILHLIDSDEEGFYVELTKNEVLSELSVSDLNFLKEIAEEIKDQVTIGRINKFLS